MERPDFWEKVPAGSVTTLIMDGIQVPAGERYEAVEGANGELGVYVGCTAGSPRSQGIGGSATGAVADDLAASDEPAQEP